MKSLLIAGSLSLFLLMGNTTNAQEKVKVTEDKTKTKTDGVKEKMKDDKTKIKDDNTKVKIKGEDGMTAPLPYTATYSSNFVIGNPVHGRMILDMWKDWDDNALDRHDYMADTISMYFPDGSFTKGKAASMEGAKKYRGSMTSAKSTIDAWIPLRSVDKNEDWVAIWGTETDTFADGKTQTREIHEIWRINKDGKIDLMRQFTALPTKTQ